MGSISVGEGDTYDPNGPAAELDRKVIVLTDEQNDDMSDEDKVKSRSGVDPQILREAKEKHEKGEGPRVVDLRSDKDEEDQTSPGTSFSPSSEKTQQTSNTNETSSGSTARTTDGLSKSIQKDGSTAPSTGGLKKPSRS